MNFTQLAFSIGQGVVFVLVSPGVVGVLNQMRARLSGRRGPSVFQPYVDLWKLIFHSHAQIPGSVSWVFFTAPWLVFACYAFLGFLIPVVFLPEKTSPASNTLAGLFSWPVADLLILVYLLGLARFITGLAGMDTGVPFGDLGSSREMFMHALAEPVFLLLAYALALNAYTTSLAGIIRYHQGAGQFQDWLGLVMDPVNWLALLSLGLITLLETGRMPFNNPETHLELTMTEKAALLEYAGRSLALFRWAEAMRLTFFLTLGANLFFPFWLPSWAHESEAFLLSSVLYPFKIWVLLFILVFWELTRVRRRIRDVGTLAGLGLAFSILAIVVVVLNRYLF